MAKRISLMQGMSTLFLRVDSRRNDHDAVLVCTDLSKPAATTGQYGFLGNFEIDESCVCLVNHSADRVTWTINFPGETHCSNHGYHLNQRLVIIKQLLKTTKKKDNTQTRIKIVLHYAVSVASWWLNMHFLCLLLVLV